MAIMKEGTTMRRPLSTVGVLVGALLCLVATSGLAGTPARMAYPTHPSPAASASGVGTFTVGLAGWEVQSSTIITQSGSAISTPGFSTAGFLNVAPDDAGAPGTEIEALVQNGSCPDVFVSTNMKACFGYMHRIGPDTIARFAVPWWFRTDFSGDLRPGQDASLIVNGVVGQADLWLNGREVATQATVQGAYTRYSFDVTGLLRPGDNALALEVYPNDPTAMYTLDNVDWTQIPPDNNTGIQFPIQLHVSNTLGLDNVHVLQHNAPDLSRSALTVKADVTNHSAVSQSGRVTVAIISPGGTTPSILVTQPVTVTANATQTVLFQPAAYPSLTIDSPQAWWPYQMGGQPLYTLSALLSQGNLTPEVVTETFGIRTISTYLTGASPMAPQGARVFAVNGRPFLFRGGGWSENLFLHYSAHDTANQIQLMRGMGVNGIRTEGKQMPDDFYEQMDRAGLMIDAGFQCCDFWEQTSGLTQHDYDVYQLSALAIGQHLRNHPSVINFSWSDNAPSPQQERVALAGFAQADFYPQNPLISSAEYNSSPILGPSGEKEGPYDWVPPSYWYNTTEYDPGDSTRTNAGGSWAFDSEQSAGDTVPTLDSIQRFLSPSDQTHLWQNPAYNQYHLNYEPGHVGYAFGTLYNLDVAMQKRYGSWSGLAQYVQEAQVQNYEDARAQFEAFIDHWTNRPTPATGTVYWQMNKGWPTMLWDLYNYDYDQAGSYFGAEKANESLHVLYALDTGTVAVDNLGGARQSGLSVTSRVYDLLGHPLDQQTISNISLSSQGVITGLITPHVPATTMPPTPAQTYFVELTLAQHGSTVDRNVYWLSTQQDLVDWRRTLGNPQATMSQYADMSALQGLPTATVTATASSNSGITTVTITNTSRTPIVTVGFFLRADVRRGQANGVEQAGDNEVLPITWSDNDITLWPGESQTLTATYDPSLLQGARPVVSIQGWNVPRFVVPGR
jgi:exo-1,4-beta-D-glucosaminidase